MRRRKSALIDGAGPGSRSAAKGFALSSSDGPGSRSAANGFGVSFSDGFGGISTSYFSSDVPLRRGYMGFRRRRSYTGHGYMGCRYGYIDCARTHNIGHSCSGDEARRINPVAIVFMGLGLHRLVLANGSNASQAKLSFDPQTPKNPGPAYTIPDGEVLRKPQTGLGRLPKFRAAATTGAFSLRGRGGRVSASRRLLQRELIATAMTAVGQPRHIERAPGTSDLPRTSDVSLRRN